MTARHAYEATSLKARAEFLAAMDTWKFKPFIAGGRAIAVCSMARLSYPPGAAPTPEVVPIAPPPSHGEDALILAEGGHEPANPGGRQLVEGKRISGHTNVVPDDHTMMDMMHSTRSEHRSHFRVCVDTTGHIESVVPLRSTGYASYDRALLQAIRGWVYSPYKIDGRPVPVCTGVTFVYRQTNGRRPRRL